MQPILFSESILWPICTAFGACAKLMVTCRRLSCSDVLRLLSMAPVPMNLQVDALISLKIIRLWQCFCNDWKQFRHSARKHRSSWNRPSVLLERQSKRHFIVRNRNDGLNTVSFALGKCIAVKLKFLFILCFVITVRKNTCPGNRKSECFKYSWFKKENAKLTSLSNLICFRFAHRTYTYIYQVLF